MKKRITSNKITSPRYIFLSISLRISSHTFHNATKSHKRGKKQNKFFNLNPMEDAASQSSSKHETQIREDKKFNFLYKSVFLALAFLALLQLIISSSCELLQLVFVGMAVSYGLFCRKTDESDDYYNNQIQCSKLYNAPYHVSKLLQIPSILEDESENPILTDDDDDRKVQTWNSTYYGEKPLVVMAKENASLDEDNTTASVIKQKALLLPVRTLKLDDEDLVYEFASKTVSSRNNMSGGLNLSRSRVFSKTDSREPRIDVFANLASPSTDEREYDLLESIRSFRSHLRHNNPSTQSPSPSPSNSAAHILSTTRSFVSSKSQSSEAFHQRSFPFSTQSNAMSSDRELKHSVVAEETEESSKRTNPRSVRTFRTASESSPLDSWKRSTDDEIGCMDTRTNRNLSNDEDSEIDDDDDKDMIMGQKDLRIQEETKNVQDDDDEDNVNYYIGKDVDKKADEFIAKFREQIRIRISR